MSHLLAIAVGPVQEFIAAARRTRDLWFGSYLLSEISRAVAKSVEADGGKLIFPASSAADNVANVILAELPSAEPRDVAAKAKQAAKDCWRKLANESLQRLRIDDRESEVIREKIWSKQVCDVIEFYAAWVSYEPSKYGDARKKVMRLLAGRKNLRDFEAGHGVAGLPKSSLDGQRETVLYPKADWPRRFQSQLRVRTGEQLDVVGVVKRIGEGNVSFASVSRLASDVWIRGIAKQGGKDVLAKFTSHCEQLPREILHKLDPVTFAKFADFPFEGTALFRSRHHEWWEETEDAPEREQRREPPEWYADFDKQLKLVEEYAASHGIGKEPNPYLAVLVADGDKMGAIISALTSSDTNREFSSTLAGFANSARTIVNQHSGVLVYAGGDDVLAFLPVDKCLGCARRLHDDFGELLAKYGNPTLSVGIAIGHFMENLEDLLDYGRAAEKAAKKPDRDGLAVHLHKRGGAPIGVRARWNENPDHRLERFANLMNDGIIPTKLPYELRAMAKLYESPSWAENADAAIQQDLYRLIAKKTSRGSGTVRQALSEFVKEMNSGKLMTLASELLVARQIATALRQATGRSVAAEEVTS